MATSAENYKVYAELIFQTRTAADQLKSVRDQAEKTGSFFQKLGKDIRTGIGQGLGIGVVQMTQRAVGGMIRLFRGAIDEAVSLNAEMDRMRISLGAVLSAVQGTSFEQGIAKGAKIFEQLKEDSITSVATASQMLNIYQGIAGPLSKAGASLQKIREMTRDSVAAATTLGVDFQQAQRDMMLMASGAAGLDVKLFRMLRATGAITESTEEWNQMIPAERVEKMGKALAKFRGAADAFGRSWEGVTSTMRGIREEMTLALTEKAFQTMAGALKQVNDMILANKKVIFGYLKGLGQQLANLARVSAAFGLGATVGSAEGGAGFGAMDIAATTVRPMLQLVTEAFGVFADVLRLVWTLLEPVVLLMQALWGTLNLLLFPVRAFMASLRLVLMLFQALAEVIVGPLNSGILGLISDINDVARAFDLWMKDLYDGVYYLVNEVRELFGLERIKPKPYQMGEYAGPEMPDSGKMVQNTINDFRGSRIEIKQDFRNADPDRIAFQVTRDIQKQASMRVRSGLAPGFTG